MAQKKIRKKHDNSAPVRERNLNPAPFLAPKSSQPRRHYSCGSCGVCGPTQSASLQLLRVMRGLRAHSVSFLLGFASQLVQCIQYMRHAAPWKRVEPGGVARVVATGVHGVTVQAHSDMRHAAPWKRAAPVVAGGWGLWKSCGNAVNKLLITGGGTPSNFVRSRSYALFVHKLSTSCPHLIHKQNWMTFPGAVLLPYSVE